MLMILISLLSYFTHSQPMGLYINHSCWTGRILTRLWPMACFKTEGCGKIYRGGGLGKTNGDLCSGGWKRGRFLQEGGIVLLYIITVACCLHIVTNACLVPAYCVITIDYMLSVYCHNRLFIVRILSQLPVSGSLIVMICCAYIACLWPVTCYNCDVCLFVAHIL